MGLPEKKELRLFCVRLAAFLILFFVLDQVIGELIKYAYFSQRNKFTYGIRETKADVIIVGSSRAQHHYIPSIITDTLGLTCFNMGSNAQNIYYDYGIVGSILERYTPKIILLDLTSSDYSVTDKAHSTENLSVFLPYYKSGNIIQEVVNLRGPLERIKRISKIYQFNSQITNIFYSLITKDKNPYFSNDGYIPISGEISKPLETMKEEKTVIDTNKVEYINKIISLCVKLKVRLIMVMSPIYVETGSSYSSNVIQLIATQRRVEFWNFKQDSSFLADRTLFKDVNHLNHVGAKKYSIMIAQKLKIHRQI